MPDPKLKIAAAEIEAILQKHDIAGIVMLQSPSHLEYIMAIAPSWSCCWIEDYGNGAKAMRVKAKREDFPSKAAHVEALGNSIGMILGFTDCCESMRRNLAAVAETIATKTKIEFSHYTQHEPNPPLPPEADRPGDNN